MRIQVGFRPVLSEEQVRSNADAAPVAGLLFTGVESGFGTDDSPREKRLARIDANLPSPDGVTFGQVLHGPPRSRISGRPDKRSASPFGLSLRFFVG